MRRYWLALAAFMVVEVCGTYACARWLRGDGRGFLAACGALYCTCTALWLYGVSGAGGPTLARALAVHPIFALLSGVMTGMAFTGERLDARGWLGVVLGCLAISLIVAGQAPEPT